MVELIPKQAFVYPQRATLFFYGSLFLLALSLAGFAVLEFLQAKTSRESAAYLEQLSREKTKEELGIEQNVLGYEQKLKDFSKILQGRTETLPFFEFLEKNTHPKVFFTQATLEPRGKKLSLLGQALDFKTLDEQSALFKLAPQVLVAQVSDIAIGEQGRASFQLTLVFNEFNENPEE